MSKRIIKSIDKVVNYPLIKQSLLEDVGFYVGHYIANNENETLKDPHCNVFASHALNLQLVSLENEANGQELLSLILIALSYYGLSESEAMNYILNFINEY